MVLETDFEPLPLSIVLGYMCEFVLDAALARKRSALEYCKLDLHSGRVEQGGATPIIPNIIGLPSTCSCMRRIAIMSRRMRPRGETVFWGTHLEGALRQ